jgi:hypothetical protein
MATNTVIEARREMAELLREVDQQLAAMRSLSRL